jgi:hypothetical protein
MADIRARPIPVFPEVGSMMTLYPGISVPSSSAFWIIRCITTESVSDLPLLECLAFTHPCDPIFDTPTNREEFDLGQYPTLQLVFIPEPVEGDERSIADGLNSGWEDALPAVVYRGCGNVGHGDCCGMS